MKPASSWSCSNRRLRNSERRKPEAYASSRIAWSHNVWAVAGCSGANNFSISELVNAFGKRFQRRGSERFSATLSGSSFSVPVSYDLGGTYGEVAGGASFINIGNGWSGFTKGSVQFGSDSYLGLSANLGVRKTW